MALNCRKGPFRRLKLESFEQVPRSQTSRSLDWRGSTIRHVVDDFGYVTTALHTHRYRVAFTSGNPPHSGAFYFPLELVPLFSPE